MSDRSDAEYFIWSAYTFGSCSFAACVLKYEVACAWERQAAPRESDVFFWAISSSERDRGWTIEVAVVDDTTDEHTDGDDSEISPGNGPQCQKIWCGCFAPDTPPGEHDR